MLFSLLKFRFILIGISALILVSCSSQNNGLKGDELVIFPPPPAEPRIQFLTRYSISTDVTGEQSGFEKFIFGDEVVHSVTKPYGAALYEGQIFVCDTKLPGIEIFDLDKNEFRYFTPGGFGQLIKPVNIFIADDGRRYIADAERGQIVVFDKDGKYIAACGAEGIDKPVDVFVYDNTIYMADIKSNRIYLFDNTNYKPAGKIPDYSEDEEGFIRQPSNIYARNDRLYVSDFGDFNIKVYDTEGNFIRKVGSFGRSFGQFVRPKGIAVDKQDRLYVVDAGFENVQIFNDKGQLLLFFGGTYQRPGDMWLPAKVIIDYDNLEYFRKYVYEGFNLEYLILVTNQYGPDKISVYGFVSSKN